MKKVVPTYFYILTAFILLSATSGFAQDDKKTKKEWAKKMKAMDPLEFKRIVESSESFESEKASLNGQISDLESQIAEKNDKISELESKLESGVSTVKETSSSVTTSSSSSSSVGSEKGVIFKVQIGAFRNKDLTKYFENNKNFSGDVDADGTKKYTLGLFKDYWEADNFKKYLREMGVKDAWIVAYRNGQRQNIKDVLEGVIK